MHYFKSMTTVAYRKIFKNRQIWTFKNKFTKTKCKIISKLAEEQTVFIIKLDVWNDLSKISKKNMNYIITDKVL